MEPIMLSFIVPVYNVEDYLVECVESLIIGEMENTEIILIDDGSKDNSGIIGEKLAQKYACVSCYHQKNAGVSSARNAGLQKAQGKYVTFFDADDRATAGSIEEVLRWARKADSDICFLQARKLFPNGKTTDLGDGISRAYIDKKDKIEVFHYLATRSKYSGSACTKLFKKDLLDQNNIVFSTGRRYGEDLSFVLRCLLAANRFDALDMPYYEYRQNRENSSTNVMNEMHYFDLFQFIAESVEMLTHDKKPKSEIDQYALAFVAYEYSLLLWHFNKMREANRQKAFSLIKEYGWVLKYGFTSRLKTIRLAKIIFGAKGTSKLLSIYMDSREK